MNMPLYGSLVLFVVVPGWIGFLTTVVRGHRTTIFAPVMLSFIALLIWVIQMRWFLVAYLG